MRIGWFVLHRTNHIFAICFLEFFRVDRKETLIEKLGVHIENKEQIAPLAARIISYLILKGKKGATFERLVCDLKASKSTIFTHLTTLQALQRISYYTKPGDRKKYFIISPDSLVNSIDEMVDMWYKEHELHLEVTKYKKEVNATLSEDSDERFDIEFHTIYLEYLDQVTKLMQDLRSKLLKNHTND